MRYPALLAAASRPVHSPRRPTPRHPQPAIKSAGQSSYCSDISYPPEESFAAGNKAIGSDINYGTGIANLMGVKATFKNTTFDWIIAGPEDEALRRGNQRMNDTPERRKQVDFVDYLKVGQSLMVKRATRSTSRRSRPSRASASRSSRARRTATSSRPVDEARRRPARRRSDRDLPEGHRRGFSAEARPRRLYSATRRWSPTTRQDKSFSIGGSPMTRSGWESRFHGRPV